MNMPNQKVLAIVVVACISTMVGCNKAVIPSIDEVLSNYRTVALDSLKDMHLYDVNNSGQAELTKIEDLGLTGNNAKAFFVYGSADDKNVIVFPFDSVLDTQQDFQEGSQRIPCCYTHRHYENVLVAVWTTVCVSDQVVLDESFKFGKQLFKARISGLGEVEPPWQCFEKQIVVPAVIDCYSCSGYNSCTVVYVLNGQTFSYSYIGLLPNAPVTSAEPYPIPCGNCPNDPLCPSNFPTDSQLRDIVLSR